MFVLDTDHLVIMQRQADPEWSRMRARMARHERADFYLTIISFHEQVMGANTFISRAKGRAELVRGYRLMEGTLVDFSQFIVLPFDELAAIQFENLRGEGVRIGTMYLRITAIALSHNFTVLTRNTLDFGKVSALKVQDWTATT